MTGTVLELLDVITPDMKAVELSRMFMDWDQSRNDWRGRIKEVLQYLYATDTSHTSNNRLPWKNKTTTPKLCQIADNLEANYLLTMFPKLKSLFWLANERDANSKDKRDAIQNYIYWCISQPQFKKEFRKLVLDFIHKGNAIGTVEWQDYRAEQADGTQMGYVGPGIRRINPEDCVINPTADSFNRSPKFIRTIITMGELKEYLQRLSNDDNTEAYQKLFDYLKEIRGRAKADTVDWTSRDDLYTMDGFGSFRDYLSSDCVELLTFYGDWYDPENDTFGKNRVITFVDRHKIIDDKANPSNFGTAPIYHAAWRQRQDNVWGMGPLENLVGMQYRIDHLENQKADCGDFTIVPVIKVKGMVQEFTWQPGEKIWLEEPDADVEVHQPNVQLMQLDSMISYYEAKMEEMAGAPREAMGIRSPGEKTKYEVQSLENAASRIFQNKINQFEEQILEPLINAMLELARRNMVNTTAIPVFDDTYKMQKFQELTVEDITGIGRIRVVGSRHFAEQAELVQNLGALSTSPVWQYIQPHFSSQKLAKLYEDLFNLGDYEIVSPDVGIYEQADAQRKIQAIQEQLHSEMGTASGIGGDYDMNPAESAALQPQQAPE